MNCMLKGGSVKMLHKRKQAKRAVKRVKKAMKRGQKRVVKRVNNIFSAADRMAESQF